MPGTTNKAVRWSAIEQQLTEGRAVEVDGRVVRFFPSLRDVATAHGVSRSTLGRWAKRAGIGAARRARLARDRGARRAGPTSVERYLEQTLALVSARWATRRRPPSTRQVVLVLRLIGGLIASDELGPGCLRQLERLRTELLARVEVS